MTTLPNDVSVSRWYLSMRLFVRLSVYNAFTSHQGVVSLFSIYAAYKKLSKRFHAYFSTLSFACILKSDLCFAFQTRGRIKETAASWCPWRHRIWFADKWSRPRVHCSRIHCQPFRYHWHCLRPHCSQDPLQTIQVSLFMPSLIPGSTAEHLGIAILWSTANHSGIHVYALIVPRIHSQPFR